jgi:hypothetical protein
MREKPRDFGRTELAIRVRTATRQHGRERLKQTEPEVFFDAQRQETTPLFRNETDP